MKGRREEKRQRDGRDRQYCTQGKVGGWSSARTVPLKAPRRAEAIRQGSTATELARHIREGSRT